MTADLLSTISGALLSLGFSYLPGASDWFSRFDGRRKRLLMLALLFSRPWPSLGWPAPAGLVSWAWP